jgi:hypothetical protein
MRPSPRHGTILIIVAGLSALLASMALVFLARMRSDAEESQITIREAQAHIMLVAACNYIQEASRLGYDDEPGNPWHKEAYGWIDVRDGTVGPKPTALAPDAAESFAFGSDDSSRFPLETPFRFPMEVMEIPPFAISLTAAPNPINPNTTNQGAPWLVNEDPVPVLSLAKGNSFEDFERGRPNIRPNSANMAWFRLYRLGGARTAAHHNPASFVVTCGAGGTRGYRTWSEVPPADRPYFADDPTYFESLAQNEVRLWYLVEWSPAIGGHIYHNTKNDRAGYDQYGAFAINASHDGRSQGHAKNFGGTMRFIQRLPTEPDHW